MNLISKIINNSSPEIALTNTERFSEKSNLQKLEISISPLPLKDRLLISSNELILSYGLYDVLGQEILNVSGLNSKTISQDFSFLAKGKYVLRLKTKRIASSYTVIKE